VQLSEQSESTKPQSVDPLIRFSQWLLLLPLIVLFIFACAQLAILSSRYVPPAAIAASRSADYMPWRYLPFKRLNDGIVAEILKDRGLPEEPIRERDRHSSDRDSGTQSTSSALGETHEASTEPAPGATVKPTGTATATPTTQSDPNATNTPTASPSPTSSPTQSTATATSTSAATETATATPTPTEDITPTPPAASATPGSTDRVTYWLSSETLTNSIHALVPEPPSHDATSGTFLLFFSTGAIGRTGTMRNDLATVELYAENDRASPATISISLGADAKQIGTATLLVPENTLQPALLSTTMQVEALQIYATTILSLNLSVPQGVSVFWDGNWNASRIILPMQLD
jgi:cytoskeletal protein RodZ